MEKLWAPWRKAYIRCDRKKAPKGCLFCGLLKEKRDPANFILKRSAFSFAVLNLYPYNNGHVLILPQRHVAGIEEMKGDEKLDWLSLCESVQAAIRKKMSPHGFNLGINLGHVAGSGIPDHLHLHIVPRWVGDVNFMPVTGNTKVISQSLRSVYRELTGAIPDGSRKGGLKNTR